MKTLRVGCDGRWGYCYSVVKDRVRIADDGVSQDRRLESRISGLRKGILEIHKNFPSLAKPIENKPVPEEKPPETPKSEPTAFVTETAPEVLAAYRREFPNHKIVVVPADNVAKGIDIEDDLPSAPRKAA